MNKLYTLLNNMFMRYQLSNLGFLTLGIAIGYILMTMDVLMICGDNI